MVLSAKFTRRAAPSTCAQLLLLLFQLRRDSSLISRKTPNEQITEQAIAGSSITLLLQQQDCGPWRTGARTAHRFDRGMLRILACLACGLLVYERRPSSTGNAVGLLSRAKSGAEIGP